MKNLKFLLPMLAFVFAIGVAFTSPDIKEEPTVQAYDYYFVNGSWEAVPQQNCSGTKFICRIQMGTNGPIYELYDEENDTSPKRSSSENPIIINP